jgi:3-hydroxymyristoyl/3-hydroxydecanoyl-(acyl carrier protein) dehydratase
MSASFELQRVGAETSPARFQVRIPERSALFAGHFPDQPVLPGVAQLAIVERAVNLLVQRSAAVIGVRHWKLRARVPPGSQLVLELSPQSDSSWRFVITAQDGTAVSSGAVEISS